MTFELPSDKADGDSKVTYARARRGRRPGNVHFSAIMNLIRGVVRSEG